MSLKRSTWLRDDSNLCRLLVVAQSSDIQSMQPRLILLVSLHKFLLPFHVMCIKCLSIGISVGSKSDGVYPVSLPFSLSQSEIAADGFS